MDRLNQLFEQFLQERTYLKNVTPKTRIWYESAWKAFTSTQATFVGRYDDAEDLTQEIFVRLLRALPTYDRRANFETWLTSVSRNYCIDHYRKIRREHERFTHDADADVGITSHVQRVVIPDAAGSAQLFERLAES